MIDRLKGFEWFKRRAKKTKETFQYYGSFYKRDRALSFYSWRTTLNRARATSGTHNDTLIQDSAIENIPGLTVCKDVISYPIIMGKEKWYAGGLIDSKTNLLIPEAIHFREDGLSQELPVTDVLIGGDLPEIDAVMVYGGILYNHFGHFLLESLGRLWAYQHVKQLNPYIFFHNDMGYPDYLQKTNFIYQVFKGFNIPLTKILFIDYKVRLKNIIIPAQKYGYGFCRKPDAQFLQFLHGFKFPGYLPKGFEKAGKIYVSRSKIRLGRVVGERLFEGYLGSEGYSIFYPELYTLYEQLAVYSKAEKIIFCDGAALHACILLPQLKAAIAVIARRRDPRYICSEIIDQFTGYGQKVSWIDFVIEQYQFGLESWHALSVVKWFEISEQLQRNGFVNSVCHEFDEVDISILLREELRKHMSIIKDRPEFINFLMRLKESLPAPAIIWPNPR